MPMFEYTARNVATWPDPEGAARRPTKDEVGAYLRKNRLILVNVREAPKQIKHQLRRRQAHQDPRHRHLHPAVRDDDQRGPAAGAVAEHPGRSRPRTRRCGTVTRAVVYDVESGNTLADAFAKHPKAFTELYVNMVAAGEAGGILDTILLRLATFLEKNDALVRKVKGAMVYPGVIITVAGVAIAILLIFVIPTFQSMFASAGLELPLPTRIVIGMSNFLIGYWWAMVLAIGGFVFAIRRTTPRRTGGRSIDAGLLKSPVLGDMLRKSAVSRFTRTLGTLVSSGVSILEGLEITAKTAGNRVVHDAVMESRNSIAGGETIAAPLERSKVFPPMVISDDRGRRADRRPGRDADARSPTSTTKRWTWR